MPTIEVNGVNIVFEMAGEGTPIVYTPGGFAMREREALVFAGRLSAKYKVLVWDRRNCGYSDVAIVASPSEFHLWADDIHRLLRELEMTPAYFGGRSGGCVLSLLMAHRYPNDVKGLLLQEAPTDNVPEALSPIAEHHCYRFAEVAESSGMEAVIAESSALSDWAWVQSWIADSIERNAENRERILAVDPAAFASTMRTWGEWIESERFYLANLRDDEIGAISAPAYITPGLNMLHPKHTAERLYRLMPNAEWNGYFDEYTDQSIQEIADATDTTDLSTPASIAILGPFYENFLQRVESGTFVADRK